MRLHRFIGQSGYCSRRKAEELILEGRVMLNGAQVSELGVTIDPNQDVVEIDGKVLCLPSKQVYIFYKPKGVVTTLSDPFGRKTISEYFPHSSQGLKPVGRLDINTDGLIILTNDGELATRLMHPSYQIDKEYLATVIGLPDSKDLSKLNKGLWIEGGKTAPAKAEVLAFDEKSGQSKVSLTIHEGRKHQVKLMFGAIGHDVVQLRRIRIGPFLLKGLSPGQARRLGQKEVQSLKQMVGLGS